MSHDRRDARQMNTGTACHTTGAAATGRAGRYAIPSRKPIEYVTSLTVIAALGLSIYLIKISKALSYLTADPKACINCHVMNTQYATWQHSSHARSATCIDCHLPTGDAVAKYLAKARDGWNHATAFTLGTYRQRITISADGAARVQTNCMSCHARLAMLLRDNSDSYHDFHGIADSDDIRCWTCHRDVPHGLVRGLSATPYNLGVRELQ